MSAQTLHPASVSDRDLSVAASVARARAAQSAWENEGIRERLRVIRGFRLALAGQAERVPQWASPHHRAGAEALASEGLPVLAGARWLERRAARVLRPRRLGRPLWLGRGQSEVLREARGVVLVIAPGNYPFMLPVLHVLWALAAGNTVLLKPAPGGEAAAEALEALLREAGASDGVFGLLPSDPRAARRAIGEGVDHIVFTGSWESGRAVAGLAAQGPVSMTAELSGCDAFLVLPGADLDLVVRSLRFGLEFNESRTCIAPRRLFAVGEVADALCERLGQEAALLRPARLDPRCQVAAEAWVAEARARGARVLAPEGGWPAIVHGAPAAAVHPQTDLGAPILGLARCESVAAALEEADRSAYALGAAVFGPLEAATRAARRLRCGFVAVNDLIVPSADPALPFGGRGRSGFGVTRGPEGLLEMTQPKVVSVSFGRTRRHLEQPRAADEELLAGLARLIHGGAWRTRLRGLKQVLAAGRRRARRRGGAPAPSSLRERGSATAVVAGPSETETR